MRKKGSKSLIFLFVMLVCAMFLSSSAVATIYYTDGFEDVADDANPNDTWYDYTENNEYTFDNVSIDDFISGTAGFYLNDSAHTEWAYSNFSISTASIFYDEFSFKFKINDVRWHNKLNITFLDGSAQVLGYINITNTSVSYNNTGNEVYTHTIAANMTYKVDVQFNFTTDRIGYYIYNETDGGALIGYDWGDMEDGAGSYTSLTQINFVGEEGGADEFSISKTSVWFDDFSLAYTYVNQITTSTNSFITSTIVVLFAAVVLVTVMGLAFTGNLTPDSLVYLAVVSIIGVLVLMVISGLL